MTTNPATRPVWPFRRLEPQPKAPTQNLDELPLAEPEKALLTELQREHKRFTDMRPGQEKAELLDELRKLKRRLEAIKTTEAAQTQMLEWQTLLY